MSAKDTWTRGTLLLAGSALAVGLAGASAASAQATGCTPGAGSASGTAAGCVQISTANTLTLSSQVSAGVYTGPPSFALAYSAGAPISTPTSGVGALDANVMSNDPLGYSLTNTIGSAFTSGANSIPSSAITPWADTRAVISDASGAWSANSFGTTATQTVASQATPSEASGDNWDQAWQFNLPSGQPAGTYQGTITVVLIGV
jgi:hypothetical protein